MNQLLVAVGVWLTCCFVFARLPIGFHGAQSSLIPQAVVEKRHQIFKITMPHYSDVPSEHYDFFLQRPLTEPSKQDLQSCIDQDQPSCWLALTTISGTAFLGPNGDTLWTNCHIVRSWMSAVSSRQSWQSREDAKIFYAHTEIPMQLISAQGETLSRPDQGFAFLKAYSPMRQGQLPGAICNGRDDLVEMQLSRPLSEQGLVWASLNSGEVVFLGGYPRPTSTRQLFDKKDSSGENFYWTFGDSIDKGSSLDQSYLSQKQNMELAIAGAYNQLALFDSAEGMSGGPVLNQNGEVVGIYKGYVPRERDLDIPFVSLFSSIQGMRFVQILSQ
jgi:hypothetical protein